VLSSLSMSCSRIPIKSKTLSWLDPLSGGSLVKPPAQGEKLPTVIEVEQTLPTTNEQRLAGHSGREQRIPKPIPPSVLLSRQMKIGGPNERGRHTNTYDNHSKTYKRDSLTSNTKRDSIEQITPPYGTNNTPPVDNKGLHVDSTPSPLSFSTKELLGSPISTADLGSPHPLIKTGLYGRKSIEPPVVGKKQQSVTQSNKNHNLIEHPGVSKAVEELGRLGWSELKQKSEEHAKYATQRWNRDHMSLSMGKLPSNVRPAVRGMWLALRTGDSYSSHVDGHNAAEQVSRSRGLQPEHSRALRAVMSMVDVHTLKVVPVRLDGEESVSSKVPLGAMTHLAYTGDHEGLQKAKDAIAKVRGKFGGSGSKAWVTIGGHAEGGKQHAGGTPVDIEGGVIAKGPMALKGDKVENGKVEAPKVKEGEPAKEQPTSEGTPSTNQPAMIPAHIIKTHQAFLEEDTKGAKAVAYYSMGGYESLNKAMRNANFDYELLNPDQKKLLDKIENVISKVPEFEHPVETWRGIRNASPDVLKALERTMEYGSDFQLPSLTSTTLDQNVVIKQFAQKEDALLFKISAKKGLYVESVTSNLDEHEMIMSSKARYIVTNIEDAEVAGAKRKVVHLEQIS